MVIDETPANNVRLFPVTAGGKTLGMAGRRTGLTYLIHESHKVNDGLTFAALVDERLAATQRRVGFTKEIQDESFGLLGMNFSIGLLFGPTGTCNKE
jgi:hypothetical protein